MNLRNVKDGVFPAASTAGASTTPLFESMERHGKPLT